MDVVAQPPGSSAALAPMARAGRELPLTHGLRRWQERRTVPGRCPCSPPDENRPGRPGSSWGASLAATNRFGHRSRRCPRALRYACPPTMPPAPHRQCIPRPSSVALRLRVAPVLRGGGQLDVCPVLGQRGKSGQPHHEQMSELAPESQRGWQGGAQFHRAQLQQAVRAAALVGLANPRCRMRHRERRSRRARPRGSPGRPAKWQGQDPSPCGRPEGPTQRHRDQP